MLSPIEMNHIVEQEKFRWQIRTELEKKEKKDSKLLTFFNSTLGIFVLSTILVSFLSWAYTTYTAYSKNKEDKEQRISALQLEIANRTEAIEPILLDTITINDMRQLEVEFTGNLNDAVQFGPVASKSFYTLEEFRRMALLPMVAELKRLKKDEGFDKTFEVYKKVYQIYVRLQKELNSRALTRADVGIAKVHLSNEDETFYKNEYQQLLLKD
ncbi:MAG TPA: hypothetical protein VGM31_14560 [Puia sp.]|jgi:hypothetical protein